MTRYTHIQPDTSRTCDLFDTFRAVIFVIVSAYVYSMYCVVGAAVVDVVIILCTTGSGVTDKSVSEYYSGHNGTNPVLKIRFII